MSGQLSLLRAHVPDAVARPKAVEDLPLPGFDVPQPGPVEQGQGISPDTRAVCTDEVAKAGLARLLRRIHRFEHVAKRVCRDTGADLRTVQNWLQARNLPDDDGRRRLVAAYGPRVLRVIYEGADPDKEAPL